MHRLALIWAGEDAAAADYGDTFLEMQEPNDDAPDGLPAMTALGSIANFAADDWLRALRPDLRVHPMGAYEFIARAVVIALDGVPGMLGPAAAAMVADARGEAGDRGAVGAGREDGER